MRVLVTGFEPFGGDRLNPSAEIARNMPRSIAGIAVSTAVLPVVYYHSLAMLRRMIALSHPDMVICMGLAGGRTRLSFETNARNLNEARIADNIGQQPFGEEIHRRGRLYLPPTLPLRSIARRLRGAGIRFELSTSAGTFLCNHVFYGLVDQIHGSDPALMGGFVHVPYLMEMTTAHPGAPTRTLEELVRGMCETIAVLTQ